MSTSAKALISVAALITAFALGRFTHPVSVTTETKTATTDVKQADTRTDTDRNNKTDTVITKLRHPDGTTETRTEIKTDTQTVTAVDKRVSDTKAQSTDQTSQTTYAAPKVHLNAMAGYSIHDLSTPVYGGSVSKDFLGTLSLGAWGLSSGVVGVSVGLSL